MIIYSGRQEIKNNEVGIYFEGAKYNFVPSPVSFSFKAKEGQPAYSAAKKRIVSKYYDDKIAETYTSVVEFSIDNRIDNIAVPCPLLKIEGIKALRNLLDEYGGDINIRLILHPSHLKTITAGYHRIFDRYILKYYISPDIRYSINPNSETSEDLEKKRREREERYRKSLDYSNHVKLSPEELKLELAKSTPFLEKSFSDLLFDLIKEKQIDEVELYKRSNIDKRLFSKIRGNSDYKPSKSTAISLCIGLRLNIEETEMLLNTLGFSLSRSNLSDVIVKAFILNEVYDIDEINLCLLERGVEPLSYY